MMNSSLLKTHSIQQLLNFLAKSVQFWVHMNRDKSKPNLTEWVKAFVVNQFNFLSPKSQDYSIHAMSQ